MVDIRNPNDQIMNAKTDLMKWHYEYDVYERPIAVYECGANADHGAQCMKTTYTYVGTSSAIVGAKETVSTWDSVWDI